MTILYVAGLLEKIKCVTRKYKMCTAFKNQIIVGQYLINTKPNLKMTLKTVFTGLSTNVRLVVRKYKICSMYSVQKSKYC